MVGTKERARLLRLPKGLSVAVLLLGTPAFAKNSLTIFDAKSDAAVDAARPSNINSTLEFTRAGNRVALVIPGWVVPDPTHSTVYAQTRCGTNNAVADRVPDSGSLAFSTALDIDFPDSSLSQPCDLNAFEVSKLANNNWELAWQIAGGG